MFKYDLSKVKIFDEVVPSKQELENVLFFDSYSILSSVKVTKINDVWFYYKCTSRHEILNELIGSYLANYIDLDTVSYKLGLNDCHNELCVLSKSFKEPGSQYCYVDETFETNENIVSNLNNKVICDVTKLEQLHGKLKDDILKLIVLDMYMGQYDRHGGNIMIRKKDEMTLAPMYDYSASFCFQLMQYCYSNPFSIVSMNESGIERFLIKYPFSYQTLYKLISLDIRDVLKEIEKIHSIKISNKAYKFYNNQESVKILTKFK